MFSVLTLLILTVSLEFFDVDICSYNSGVVVQALLPPRVLLGGEWKDDEAMSRKGRSNGAHAIKSTRLFGCGTANEGISYQAAFSLIHFIRKEISTQSQRTRASTTVITSIPN